MKNNNLYKNNLYKKNKIEEPKEEEMPKTLDTYLGSKGYTINKNDLIK